ncbi:hypothetical protein ACE7GA_15915 [Roseomonas sp. CCTCC AB2023176]|uniref:hypothetical protein n=1 Tax=Roseomonas sp. CCTCC AB2023176 TaxID=3342640 RepID=UPI0035D56037
MAGLSLSEGGLRDRMAAKERESRASGATSLDIALSRDSGMDARDINFLRDFTAQRKLLIVFRCPKPSARAFHGDLPGKTFATKAKTNDSGTVYGHGGTLMVSDYDMMSIWRSTGSGFQKIFTSALAPGAPRGKWSEEARDLVRAMNQYLVTRLQHGCQDDFLNREKNPGVKMADHFLAIRMGHGTYLRDPVYCENFYRAHALWWPYDTLGKHTGREAGT